MHMKESPRKKRGRPRKRLLGASAALLGSGAALILFGGQLGSTWPLLLGVGGVIGGLFVARPLAQDALEWLDRRGL